MIKIRIDKIKRTLYENDLTVDEMNVVLEAFGLDDKEGDYMILRPRLNIHLDNFRYLLDQVNDISSKDGSENKEINALIQDYIYSDMVCFVPFHHNNYEKAGEIRDFFKDILKNTMFKVENRFEHSINSGHTNITCSYKQYRDYYEQYRPGKFNSDFLEYFADAKGLLNAQKLLTLFNLLVAKNRKTDLDIDFVIDFMEINQ